MYITINLHSNLYALKVTDGAMNCFFMSNWKVYDFIKNFISNLGSINWFRKESDIFHSRLKLWRHHVIWLIDWLADVIDLAPNGIKMRYWQNIIDWYLNILSISSEECCILPFIWPFLDNFWFQVSRTQVPSCTEAWKYRQERERQKTVFKRFSKIVKKRRRNWI